MVVVQKQNSMAFKMKSSIAKLTNSPAKQEKTYQQAQADSTASYNMQLEKNKLIDYHNREILATNPQNYKGYTTPYHNYLKKNPGSSYEDFEKSKKTGREMLDAGQKFDANGNPIDPNASGYYSSEYRLTAEQKKTNERLVNQISQHRANAEKAKDKYRSISDKQKALGVYLQDESFLMGQDVIDNENIEIGDDGYYYTTSGDMDVHTTSFKPADPIQGSETLYRHHSKTDDLRPKSKRVQQQKIQTMKSKNVEFLPVNQREFTPKRALPMELATDSDYFTVTSKYHHSGNKYILKDSAGREVDRVTKEEYQEKYGDFLQRGTKKYGKQNLQRRLYIKK